MSSNASTLVSGDFVVDEPGATQAMVVYYRSNNEGTLETQDSWIEDCSSHREITNEWVNESVEHTVNSGEGYQVYAGVRNYPCEATPATFGVTLYEYDSGDNLLGTYQTDPAIADEALSEYPEVFQGCFEKHHTNAVYVKVGFVNTAGAGRMILESACVGEVLP